MSRTDSGLLGTLQFSSIYGILLLGLAFHAIYILSIFDIYFRSPLVQNLPATDPVLPAPAKRLVLFVGDGLRADKCFEKDAAGKVRSPYLRSVAEQQGVWGVSHTRVPTESRPGHVAMIAGFYEDVSAVTKGWKHNPVEFDHILRRASYAWAFGAPEIVALFPGPNVTSQSYSEDMIDFAKDALELDRWSFARLAELFDAAQKEDSLKAQLQSDKVVIFVHLLGLDTNGHAFRPHSKEYLENVSFVDSGVQKAVSMIDSFFGDNKTAYIFTSDHGMSDAGTHGDGDPDNTRCPLIVWGAGIGKPQQCAVSSNEDWTQSWGLGHFMRRDVNQADLTPLMASLVGIPIPINSEGILPVDYLGGTSESFRAQAMLRNLQQLAVTLVAKESHRARKEPFFQPFEHPATEISLLLGQIQELIDAGHYSQALQSCARVQVEIFRGLKYYQKYDWFLLRSVISLGYVGWMVHVFFFMTKLSSRPQSGSFANTAINIAFLCLSLFSVFYLLKKDAPIQYFFYFAFPIFFWYSNVQKGFCVGLERLFQTLKVDGSLFALLAYAFAMEGLVVSFFQRSFLSVVVPALAIGLLGLIRGWNISTFSASQQVLLPLFVAVAIFPLLSPIQHANNSLLFLGVLSIVMFGTVMATILQSGFSFYRKLLFTVLIGLAAVLVYRSDVAFAAKAGVSAISQQLTWTLLIISLSSPITLTRPFKTPPARLLALFLGLAPAYIILSISYH